jgi:predicted Zn-dependent protease
MTIAQALEQAIAHHRANKLQDAERLYRAILKAQPGHADANHNLGVIAVQAKQATASLAHFKAALEAKPGQGQYWISYINALALVGRIDSARSVLAQGKEKGLKGPAIDALEAKLAAAPAAGKPAVPDEPAPAEKAASRAAPDPAPAAPRKDRKPAKGAKPGAPGKAKSKRAR